MRHCSKCLKLRRLSSFYRRKTGPRAGEHYEKCIKCMRARGVMYYHSNHERQLRLAIIRRHRAHKFKKSFVDKIKSKPCADCGKIYPPIVMDFDHRIDSEKIREIARMITGNWSLENIQREMAKCDIVCANCHRIRTFNKRQAEIA